ncbi:protein YLS3-like isoform X3 [Solanum pennellii]|uniref:Protein YLS3-like isoform X3 n=1 Tax=Solanum pennellii TaxID=28526 RepID=A0ABM1HM04_SOLPN|nr:protein YLS3-like isoform X3 [Solanum pennellii]
MDSKRIEIGLTLTLVLVFMQLDGVRAQSGCTTALVSLSPCLNYVTGNTTTPSTSCCLQLSRVVASQPRCLCSVLNGGGSSFGVSINQTQAIALPSACNVQTPPVSRCNGTGSKASGGGTSNGSIVELTATWIFIVAFTAFASNFF